MLTQSDTQAFSGITPLTNYIEHPWYARTQTWRSTTYGPTLPVEKKHRDKKVSKKTKAVKDADEKCCYTKAVKDVH